MQIFKCGSLIYQDTYILKVSAYQAALPKEMVDAWLLYLEKEIGCHPAEAKCMQPPLPIRKHNG
jgi:hypothetical protein